jgi:hypothetical protein
MSRRYPRGIRGAAAYKTCETCGATGIAHKGNGQPYDAHTRSQRHRDALQRNRARVEGLGSDEAAAGPPSVGGPATEGELEDAEEPPARLLREKLPRPARVLVSVRLDPETITRVRALKPSLSTSRHEATEGDVWRAAILAGLDVLEEQAPRQKRRP